MSGFCLFHQKGSVIKRANPSSLSETETNKNVTLPDSGKNIYIVAIAVKVFWTPPKTKPNIEASDHQEVWGQQTLS